MRLTSSRPEACSRIQQLARVARALSLEAKWPQALQWQIDVPLLQQWLHMRPCKTANMKRLAWEADDVQFAGTAHGLTS